ncbi:MAG: hypothetical protein HZC03_01360 [Candidatus Lloydbacteria bacterium]|nr:hypothetical protein [Candidatus Lloydbacteria bacterium]
MLDNMTAILPQLLIVHVTIGLIGVIASYAVLMGLLRRKASLGFLKGAAWVAAVSYIVAWFTGGYYYVVFYGKAIKPVIKAGAYPWAHTFFMETKEHFFLFLPILAIVLLVLTTRCGVAFDTHSRLKKYTALLAALTTGIGVFMALAGVVISGAVR